MLKTSGDSARTILEVRKGLGSISSRYPCVRLSNKLRDECGASDAASAATLVSADEV